ncbi:hypothetical protein PMAYCL1PPCAC_25155 [Pristionchus mayeri]|uniref:Uncharacterized protein n=1 Tax=Pristionchus mayeri TaxID=1317129 RepID=A0AAN5I8G2_9BILA|nr:hypothetical protein PMAYCL1PPCAC_25155 [Pristionchus mayeri]
MGDESITIARLELAVHANGLRLSDVLIQYIHRFSTLRILNCLHQSLCSHQNVYTNLACFGIDSIHGNIRNKLLILVIKLKYEGLVWMETGFDAIDELRMEIDSDPAIILILAIPFSILVVYVILLGQFRDRIENTTERIDTRISESICLLLAMLTAREMDEGVLVIE